MPAAAIEEQIRGARLEVDRAVQLLMSPSADSLDRCAQILDSAGKQIAGFQPHLRDAGSSGNTRDEAVRLRASVRIAGRLLEGAASFHFQWARVRNSICAGYTPRGDPAAPPPRNRISIQG